MLKSDGGGREEDSGNVVQRVNIGEERKSGDGERGNCQQVAE